jgi:HTH-type transcriptional regulator, cell division transcriptional repressor
METVGKRIKRHRLKQKLTQQQLREKAGMSGAFLSDIENDKRNIGSGKLLAVSRVLNVSMDYLMTGREYKSGIVKKG